MAFKKKTRKREINNKNYVKIVFWHFIKLKKKKNGPFHMREQSVLLQRQQLIKICFTIEKNKTNKQNKSKFISKTIKFKLFEIQVSNYA